MTTTHHKFGRYEVTAERLGKDASLSAYYCIVYKDGKKILSMTTPLMTSPEETAREAKSYAV